ncbi:nicotinate-nucleotide diphosphorylase (carboxylating) [Clostridium omnivorum]|uniref:nicotinate-nucleotide diphosphorylase (carboxylating) n=2 Tax=Clostridium omnivorum TaxID=1604902 RepID=A0ABQ5N470_9CLOT|nr:nicotinate-nucleotide diphosphorylase (carboxylating) [Clostridium sp. E14]
MMNYLVIDKLIISALEEDIPNSDITTNSIIAFNSRSKVDLIAKENGIIAGLQAFERVFTLLGDVSVEFYKKDGDSVKAGDILAVVSGSTKSILSGERTALNYLQRMSGIATITNKFVNKLQGSNTKLLDTRKTTPNMRILEKYAVKIGGGCNHRFNLSDGVLLKDNHISAAGGVKSAIRLARENTSFVRKIEVEVENLEMVKEALEEAADIIMLDNMDIETMKKAVTLINKRALTECSGNVNLDNIEEVAGTGVDFVSVGALTHSAGILDLSMKNLTNL